MHEDLNIFKLGMDLERAKAVMVMVHGRGGTAENILSLTQEFNAPDFHYIAPQAYANSWYPYSFLAPIAQNEPGISSGIKAIHTIVEELIDHGVHENKIVLLGFSQGACLTLEYTARNPRNFGGIIGLSGGLIGPENTPRNYAGSFSNTSVFLGCSDLDPHIPLFRVNETEKVFIDMGAKVTKRIYPGMPHTVIKDEMDYVKDLMSKISTS